MSIEDYDKSVNINFRVPASYREAVKQQAKDLGITTSMFFRQCIEKFLNEKHPLSIPSEVLNEQADTVNSYSVSNALRESFVKFCNEYNYRSAEVQRGFVRTICTLFMTEDTVPFSDTLFYLVLFLQNSMKKQGYTSNINDIQTRKDTAPTPLLHEVREGNTVTFLVHDKENNVTYFIPFHKG